MNLFMDLAEIKLNLLNNKNILQFLVVIQHLFLYQLIPLLENKLIDSKNIVIDSKSGYSGAGKNFDLKI